MIQDWISSNLVIDYESSASNSYLVARDKEDDITFRNYQIEMITNNSISGLLPMDVRQKNDVIGLYYNVTSKITLSQFMSRKKLTRDEFIGLLTDILKILIGSRKYLLSDDCFVLHEDYIYINPSNREVSLIYLPADLMQDTVLNLKSFVIRVLVEKAVFDESSNDNFLQRILGFVRSDDFTITDLFSLLNQLREKNIKTSVINNKSEEREKITNEEKVQKKVTPSKIKKEEIKTQTHVNKYNHSIPIHIKNDENILKPISVKVGESKEVKQASTSKPISVAILVQILVIVTFFIGKGYLLNITGDAVSAYSGMGIVLFAVDFLVLRKIFDRYEGKRELTNASKRTITSDIKPLISNERIMELTKPNEENIISKQRDGHDTDFTASVKMSDYMAEEYNYKTPILGQTGMDETTVLCVNEVTAPSLSFSHDGIEEKIMITKSSFVIGRLHGQVDYVSNNNAVGKVHAEIISREDLYYVKDLNSRNGSFVNGEQIMPSKEKEIKSGDKITIANSDFVFIAPMD